MVTKEDKESALLALTASGEDRLVTDSKNWRRAFDLYRNGTGVYMLPKDLCGKCFNQVLSWLKEH